MLEIGRQFGLYVITEEISSAEGRASCKAEDPFFNREVLLKLFSPEVFGGDQNLCLMESLLEQLAALDHPSIAPLYDSGIEDLLFYYTTASYSGGSLAELSQALPADALLKLLGELAQALVYAAEQMVEHGPLRAEQLFYSADGRAVIADFGVEQGIRQLFPGEGQEAAGVTETLRSLGEVTLQLGLGGPLLDGVSDAERIAQLESETLQQLATRLLAAEGSFGSYQDLLDALGEHVELDEQTAAEQPESQYAELVGGHQEEDQPVAEPSEQAVVEVRRLVAENNSLQQSLDQLIIEKTQAENRSKDRARKLKAAQTEVEKAREEANVAWELVAGQKLTRWRPAQWAVGGFVIGFLLSGSYGYYFNQQTRDELMAKLKQQEELIRTAAWRKPEPVAAPAVAVQADPPVGNQPVQVTVATPDEQQPNQWWPAGEEFSPSAAIPLAQIKATLGMQQVEEFTSGISEGLRGEVESLVRDWASSWSQQDLQTYFAHYSESYRPELGRSQDEWRRLRKSRLTRPQWIRVQVDDLEVRQLEDNFIQVRLRQTYRSNVYQDQIHKSLNLIRENGQWRIFKERSLGMVTDIVGG
jgi:hypothetical protein